MSLIGVFNIEFNTLSYNPSLACSVIVTTPVDGATFYDRVDAYKAKLLEQGQDIEEDNTSGVNKTFANASKYKYLIVGIIVALGVVITIVIIKRKENA